MSSVDTLQSMKVFVRVAQRSSFAAAGRDLRLSPAAVTKRVAALEARVGARLFDRTTRRVGLTEAGRMYLERCLECLQAFEDADAFIGGLVKKPAGVLRVTAPVDLPGSLAEALARFMEEHPAVTVDFQLSNRPVDLVEEGFDVGLRVAHALDGRFVARELAQTRLVACAAPAYLRRRGAPLRPEELEQHRAIVFVEPRLRNEWVLERDGARVRVKLNGALLTNNGAAACAAAAAGVGLFVAPSFLVRSEIDAGRLVPLLLGWKIHPELRLFAIYPHRRFLAPKVRAFVEALRTAYGDPSKDPWWPEGETIKAARGKSARRAARS